MSSRKFSYRLTDSVESVVLHMKTKPKLAVFTNEVNEI